MSEAKVESGVPTTAGWFVVNARAARWLHNEMRAVCRFGGQGEAHFDDLGVGLYWLAPGRPISLYHHEAGQEDFLVLRGECLLIVEGALSVSFKAVQSAFRSRFPRAVVLTILERLQAIVEISPA